MLVPEAHMTGWKGVERGVGVEGRMRKAGEGAGRERWEEGERNITAQTWACLELHIAYS